MRRKLSGLLATAMLLTVVVPATAVADQPPTSTSGTTSGGTGPSDGAPFAPNGDIPIEEAPGSHPPPDIVVTYPDERDLPDGGGFRTAGDGTDSDDSAGDSGGPDGDDPDTTNGDGPTAEDTGDGGTPNGTRPTTSACASAPVSRFLDRAGAGIHTAAIDCVAWWNVTTGLPDGTFQPGGAVTRGQMATFMTNAILATGGQLPPPGSGFEDARDTVHRRAIERLAAAGIVGGFPDGGFRPNEPVTRGQMATFLVGALEHLAVDAPALAGHSAPRTFLDVPGSTHEDRIVLASNAGIAGGFDDGTYRPAAPVSRMQMATFLARLLATVTDTGVEVRAARAAVDRTAIREEICRTGGADITRADWLLAGRYEFLPHRRVTLGTDLTWAENPLGDNNWRFQFHTLRWLWPIMGAWAQTGDQRYLDHAYDMAQSWVERNPFDDPPSPYSWNDHSAAWRAMMLGCLSMHGDVPDWLAGSLAEHARLLADPDFYVSDGNHALNQDTGLLTLACLGDSWDARDLAVARIDRLAGESIDAQGVSNEQAPEYQDYNYERYLAAWHLIEACGIATPAWTQRLRQMPVVLAHMVQPDGQYVTLGDTDRRDAKLAFEHPAMRWMSTDGDQGEPPEDTFVTFDAGFTFARSGWGTERPRLDENLLSVRHGEPRAFHGHLDHGSVTLFAAQQQLLVDPGKFAYGTTDERRHVISQEAHSLVTIGDDCPPSFERRSDPTGITSTDDYDRITIRVATCPGTGWTRTLAFVRDSGDLVVVDEIAAPSTERVVQRWQLEVGALTEQRGRDLTFASWDSGATLMIEQLRPVASTTSVAGGTEPLRGWVSEHYGELTPAANLEYSAPTASSSMFITVLRPGVTGGAERSEVESTFTEHRVTLTTADGDRLTVTLPRVRP